MITLFISDLHLSSSRPEKLELFYQFLSGPALTADALYILGDLFEDFWIGVDDTRPPNDDVLRALKAYSEHSHTQLFVMPGNRDFHLDKKFAQKTGAKLIDDPQVIIINDQSVLIMHGDTLCTDDKQYQRWRRFITNPIISWLNLRMPMSLRKKIASDVRTATKASLKQKSLEIMDVSNDTVTKTMIDHKVKTLIHGHTHRQAMHDLLLNGETAKRIVLGDWYESDCVLIADESGFQFKRIAEYIQQKA